MNNFYVLPTKDRIGTKDDYKISVNSAVKKRLILGAFAVVIYQSPNINRKLKAVCRVVVDETLDETQVRVDQTLRNAVGIPFKYDKKDTTVEIYSLRLSRCQSLKNFISHILGRRFQFFRVCKADIPDIEKSFCRIPESAFNILGCEVGDNLVCESPIFEENFYKLKAYKIKGYEASEEMIGGREKMEEKDISARYPSAEKLLEVSPDIQRVFLDAHTRETLKVDPIDPICVSRDLVNLFLKQVREFGIIFFVSLIAVPNFFAYIFPNNSTLLNTGLHVIFLLIISLLLILINIRAKIK